ncbi:GT2 family glycosyltransferase [Arthrobacter sp. PvP102]|uniref:glycosyltransferase family 2 protein n=1 Tax=unclassified Arthrobacter TaxID=235627 RepID=UPI001AEA0E33|nr:MULTISPECIES: glycosyltransferase family 2 protein [unclassified Arthrobacter]MBP1232519.1 GT2 family glycosyltransferase [Arthrobacter sp. PvP103]MBP1237654.1 GT2 family glycosyltransferase [Arthrobacter sp. PvP102]
MEMPVTVVMVNYRSSEYVISCVKSLATEPIARIIILENGSGEDEWRSLQNVPSVAACDVQLIRSLENLGFGAGVNLAASCIESDYGGLIWVLNPDTVVTDGCAATLAKEITDGELDIVSPVIATGSRSSPTTWFVGGDIDHTNGSTRHWDYGQPLPTNSGVRATDFMTGAAPMMTFATWQRAGGFKESLFLYWEDADFSLRAKAIGLKMGVQLDALIWHEEGGSGEGNGRSAVYYYYMQKNRLIVESEYSSIWNLVAGKGCMETIRLLARPLREKEGRLSKLLSSVRGLAAGMRPSHRL